MGGHRLKAKGNVKRVTKPNFWGKYESKVPAKTKEFVYQHYYSLDTLSVYCDMSMGEDKSVMAVACSYVSCGQIIVKCQFVYPTRENIRKNIFGELKAVIFALKSLEKYIRDYPNVIIYSDIAEIENYLNQTTTFTKKNKILVDLQKEMSLLYGQLCQQFKNTNIKIQYLGEFKAHNPFHKSAHNAAKKMLK